MAKLSSLSLLRSARRLWRQLQLFPESLPAAAPADRDRACAADDTDADALTRAAAGLLRGVPDAAALAARVAVRWNARLRTTAGQAFPGRALVTLNPRLRGFPGEIDRTLRHELAHLLAWHRADAVLRGGKFQRRRRPIAPHGAEWRQACAELGIAGEERCHRLALAARRPAARRHVYRCPACGLDLRRVRPISPRRPLACRRCCRERAGGRFDRRFQFRKVRG